MSSWPKTITVVTILVDFSHIKPSLTSLVFLQDTSALGQTGVKLIGINCISLIPAPPLLCRIPGVPESSRLQGSTSSMLRNKASPVSTYQHQGAYGLITSTSSDLFNSCFLHPPKLLMPTMAMRVANQFWCQPSVNHDQLRVCQW